MFSREVGKRRSMTRAPVILRSFNRFFPLRNFTARALNPERMRRRRSDYRRLALNLQRKQLVLMRPRERNDLPVLQLARGHVPGKSLVAHLDLLDGNPPVPRLYRSACMGTS